MQSKGRTRKFFSHLLKRNPTPPPAQQPSVSLDIPQGSEQSGKSTKSTSSEPIVIASGPTQTPPKPAPTLNTVPSSEVPDNQPGSQNAPSNPPILPADKLSHLSAKQPPAGAHMLPSEPNPVALEEPSDVPPQGLVDGNCHLEIAPPRSYDPGPSTAEVAQARQKTLWNQACDSLSCEEKTFIRELVVEKGPINLHGESRAAAESLENLQIILQAVQEKKQKCEEGQWKINFKGHEVALCDVADRVCSKLKKFKEIGDIVVNVDPLHAGVPWAGIRLLLQIVVSGKEQMGAILLGMDKILYLIDRCKIYEILYIHNKGTEDPKEALALKNLKSALVELYILIVQFLAKAYKIFEESPINQSLSAFWNTADVEDFEKKANSSENRVEIEAGNCERYNNNRAKSEVQEKLAKLLRDLAPLSDMRSTLDALWSQATKEERNKILSWTSDIAFEADHISAKKDRTPNTGEWLLKNKKFSNWISSDDSKILWLHGIPGAGKTKLVSKVLDHLDGRQSDHALAYFYCNRNVESRRQPGNVLRSFVRQLSERTGENDMALHSALVQLYRQKEARNFASGNLTYEESKQLLPQLFQAYSKVILVFDALDECKQEDRAQLIQTFECLISSSKNLKVLISSRRNDDIKFKLEKKDKANVGISATDNQGDISKFVAEEILKDAPNRRTPLSEDLQNEIKEVLLKKSGGMFQWAALQIRQLLKLEREVSIRERLGKLPKDLKAAYDEIFKIIQDQEDGKSDIAIRAFQWVMCSKRSLSRETLVDAVCQDPETDDPNDADFDIHFVLDACQNLLEVKKGSDEIGFAHLSVQEYFDELWGDSKANNLVTKVCLLVLIHHNHWKSSYYKDDKKSKLLSYVDGYWHKHVQKCETNPDPRVSALLQTFFGSMDESGPAYRKWNTRHNELILRPSNLSSLAICYFGLYNTISEWWELGILDIKGKNQSGDPLLVLAAMSGSYPIVKLLLSKGANINAQGYHSYLGPAICVASSRGHLDIVKLLLDKGAEVNLKGGHYGTALQAASEQGHLAIVELLLDNSAEVNLEGGYYGTALQAASAEGHLAIVELLLDNSAEVNLEGGYYGTALQAASAEGHLAIVELLLDNSAEVNLEGGYYGTALQAASAEGHLAIVELLLDKSAEVNLEGGHYGTALQAASVIGHLAIVELLLDKGAEVNLKGGYYGTALQAASAEGHFDIVKLLLDKGAKVNLEGGDYGTALQAASEQGHFDIVELLLDKGAKVNLKGGNYGTALQAASGQGHFDIVELLLDKGAKVNLEGRHYGTALQAASVRGHFDIVKLLLDKGAKVNLEGRNYGTALKAASVEGHFDIVKLLLDKGAKVNLESGNYGTALQAASARGPFDIVKLLLDKGAKVNFQGGKYGTALHAVFERPSWLRKNEDLAIVKILVENGANINALDNNGHTILTQANRSGRKEEEVVIEFLRSMGAKTESELMAEDPEFMEKEFELIEKERKLRAEKHGLTDSEIESGSELVEDSEIESDSELVAEDSEIESDSELVAEDSEIESDSELVAEDSEIESD